jgi:hypothetical protein
MEKRLLIVPIVLLLTLATVACAGCPNVVTVSPSPTPVASASPITTSATTNVAPENMSAYFQNRLENQGFSIVAPFTKGTSSVSGNDQYSGTVAYGINNYAVRFEICKSLYESQQRYKDTVIGAANTGYNTTISSTANSWKGAATSGQYAGTYAWVWLDTPNHIVERVW